MNGPVDTLRENSRRMETMSWGEVEWETGEGQDVSGRNKEVRKGQRKEE